MAATDSDPRGSDEAGPRSAAVTFVTTEHFVLQGARAATIAESTGRANMFLAAVSGGLVALGLVATASSLGAAFYGFGLVLLPTLAFVGFVTFGRALQSSIEDTEYARRIARLRAYYFAHAPEIAPYLLRAPPAERLLMQRVPGDRWQGYRTVAGMVAVITVPGQGPQATPERAGARPRSGVDRRARDVLVDQLVRGDTEKGRADSQQEANADYDELRRERPLEWSRLVTGDEHLAVGPPGSARLARRGGRRGRDPAGRHRSRRQEHSTTSASIVGGTYSRYVTGLGSSVVTAFHADRDPAGCERVRFLQDPGRVGRRGWSP